MQQTWEEQLEAERTEEENQRTVGGGTRASNDEKWLSSWQQIGVSYDKCPPPISILSGSIVRRWVISCQSPRSGPADARWPSANRPGRWQGAADCWQWQVFAFSSQLPPAHCHYGLFIQFEFTWNFKNVKRPPPRKLDMNQWIKHSAHTVISSWL